MKTIKLLFAMAVLFAAINAKAQVAVNTDGSFADASAMLDIKSTSGGLLIPRMDNTAMNNIASPATGLMVYNTTFNSFYYYDGSNWVASSSGGTIYNGDGTLQGFRVVDLDNHTLSFRNSVPNHGIYITVGGNEKNN